MTDLEYLIKVIKAQEDRITKLVDEVCVIKEELKLVTADRIKMAVWLKAFERIARKRNDRLKELGDVPSDIPTVPSNYK